MAVVQLNETILEDKLEQLEKARGWSPRVISKLETFIRTSDDYDLFRINPIRYAADKNMAEAEAIDVFLHGAKIGLFEMEWHLLCASCGHVVESFSELARLHAHFTCTMCMAEQTAAMDDYIEVSFTLSPQIRDNRFRHPDTLSIEEYYFKYHQTKGVLDDTPGGRPEMTKFLGYVEPGQSISTDAILAPGVMLWRDRAHIAQGVFFVGDEHTPSAQMIHVRLENGQFHAPNQVVLPPMDFEVGAFKRHLEAPMPVASGPAILSFENASDERSPLWVMNFPREGGSIPLRIAPFLSGKRLLTTQTFRELFRSETLQSEEGIGVTDITFLFTDLKGSTAMYDAIGDPKAFYLVRQHFDTLGRVIAQNNGAVVKTIGDAVMATFMNPADAVRASLAMLKDIQDFNRSISQDLVLKIGIHRGHSIVVTLNDRLDYFGQTVNIAARVQALADADEIYLSHDAYNYPGVDTALADYHVRPEQVEVKGVRGKIRVYKVSVE